MTGSNDNYSPPHDIQAFADLDGATGAESDGAYFAQIFKPRLDIDIAEVREALQKIPDADIYPVIPEGANLTVATTTEIPHNELLIKRPSLLTYETSDPLELVRDIFLGEAQIMEQVSRINHKNIIRYYGCQVRDDRLTGIVLERHKCSLFEYFLWEWDKDSVLDSKVFMEELESAVSHLHTAGLAHNDLKPSNILLDRDHMPVLIDFGSCRPFGTRLLEGGTPGWNNSEKLIVSSDKEHDLFSLAKIREWLDDPHRQLNG
ncbi:kinase-like protein [Xylaria venustula]|nr:kinase-like protein [Xylaria venustula]